jgi:hypothetical protein
VSGRREVLGLDVVTGEDGAGWLHSFAACEPTTRLRLPIRAVGDPGDLPPQIRGDVPEKGSKGICPPERPQIPPLADNTGMKSPEPPRPADLPFAALWPSGRERSERDLPPGAQNPVAADNTAVKSREPSRPNQSRRAAPPPASPSVRTVWQHQSSRAREHGRVRPTPASRRAAVRFDCRTRRAK